MIPRAGDLNTRNHMFKVRMTGIATNLRDNVFTQRVVDIWNDLTEEVVL